MTRCPVCDALHREKNLACEAEATAALQQRYDMMRSEPVGEDANKVQERQDSMVSSRKQQLKIETLLQQHRAMAHSA